MSPKSQSKSKPENTVEQLSFEQAFAELEAIVEQLEAGQLPLEESLGMPKGSIAWFENSPAFEVIAPVGSPTVREGSSQPPGALTNVRATDTRATDTPFVRIIARYPSEPKDILLSGWALGADKIAGKAALVEVKMGKGRIILFGFRPLYRGQSSATYPLRFNAISGN